MGASDELKVNAHGRVYEPGRASCPDADVERLLSQNVPVAEIARILRHAKSTILEAARRSAHGREPHGGARQDTLGDEGRVLLRSLNARYPQKPLQFLADFLTVALWKDVKVGVVQTALKRLQITSKKPYVVYAEALSTGAINGQANHVNIVLAAARHDPTFMQGLFYVDYTGFNEQDSEVRLARAPRGQIPVVAQPSSRNFASDFHHVDLIFAVNRVLGGVAPFAQRGHTNGTIAATYLTKWLLPAIVAAVSPGGALAGVEPTVILDGASYWASPDMLALLGPLFRTYGVNILWLPPYAPWLNPIEHVNSWVKEQRRREVQQVRHQRPQRAPPAAPPSPTAHRPLHLQHFALRFDPIRHVEDICRRITPGIARGFIDHLWGRGP